MSTIDEFDDLDFSEDWQRDRPKRRVSRAERHKPRKKMSLDFDEFDEEDDYDSADDWNQYIPDDFDTFENH